MTTIRLAVPERVTKDEIIEVKALIRHAMESGFRRGARGEVITRDIITRFECTYLGNLVFAADFNPGVAANPILTFSVKAVDTGELVFSWTDQNGQSWSETALLTVE